MTSCKMNDQATSVPVILIVEDEFFIAIAIQEALRGFGFFPIGPATTVDEAVEAVDQYCPDGAIVDINLNGKMGYPVLDNLLSREIPFIVATGYSDHDLPKWVRNYPRLTKPFDRRRLRDKLVSAFAAPP